MLLSSSIISEGQETTILYSLLKQFPEGSHFRQAADALVTQLVAHLPGNRKRLKYYTGKINLWHDNKLGVTIPDELRGLESPLGWGNKVVTTVEQRLRLKGFTSEDESHLEAVDEIKKRIKFELLQTKLHTSALTHGVAYAEVLLDKTTGKAIIRAYSPTDATVLVDPSTAKPDAALVLERDFLGYPRYARFYIRSDKDSYIDYVELKYMKDTGEWDTGLSSFLDGALPVVPMWNTPSLEIDGTPRITDEIMGLIDNGIRTMVRMEITAEFFSFPQRVLIGVRKEDTELMKRFETYAAHIMSLAGDGGYNNQLDIKQLASASPEPHIAQLRAISAQVAGASSIPLNQFGIIHDNPSSADAIRAAESNLVMTCERSQTSFGDAWKELFEMCIALDTGTDRDQIDLTPDWLDPATPTKTATAQAVVQLVQAGVLPAKSRATWALLRFDDATIRALEKESSENVLDSFLDRVTAFNEAAVAGGQENGNWDVQAEQNGALNGDSTVN